MAGFLLIHGAMHGGWCFDDVAAILRAKGHTVVAPDLPGMGGDDETLRAVTLAGWTDFALGELAKLRAEVGSEPVVLAGHSRGGLNVSAAAEADPTAMDALVYITALMAPAGMPSTEINAVLPPSEAMATLRSAVSETGMIVDAETGLQIFAQISPPALAQAAMARLVTEPFGPLMTPLVVTQERWGSVPRTYIECLQDRAVNIAQQRKMLELSPGTEVITLDADHSPFLCCPEALADALLTAAEVVPNRVG